MFGVCTVQKDREAHFANMAKRYAMDAKMLRCRAAVHVENKDDIVFWSTILKHFRPNDRFHFIAGSRNEFGHETSGVTQCLKYYNFLSKDFFICIDSDYRYLLCEEGMDVAHGVLQTYTYSFENHHCFVEGLNDVCSRVTHLKNTVFDFKRFLSEYSRIIYRLFIWHLYFLGAGVSVFSKYEFNQFINLTARQPLPAVKDNGERALDDLRMRVERRVNYLSRKYPRADLNFIRRKYAALGLLPENAYLFVRGHNIYDMVSCICKEVCKVLLKRERYNRYAKDKIMALYRDRSNVDVQLKQNIKYGAYDAIRKLEEDIRLFFAE